MFISVCSLQRIENKNFLLNVITFSMTFEINVKFENVCIYLEIDR